MGVLSPAVETATAVDRRLAGFLDVRRTARTAHLPRPVPEPVLAALQAEASRFGCHLHILQDHPAIGRLAILARQATAAQFADPAVHAELWRWLRLDPRDPAYHRDGLTADCLYLRGAALHVARLTMPPERMRWLVRTHLHHVLALDTQRLVQRSASICLLTVPSARRDDFMRVGRLLLRLWLMAAQAGLSTHPVSALLDCASTLGPVIRIFGCEQAMPGAIFRMGACPPAPRSPRLPAEELIEPTL